VKKIFFAVATLLTLLNFGASAQQNFDAVQIKTTKLTDSIYMLEGSGGNIGVSVGADGVLMIDDQFAQMTPKILEAVKAITDKPVRFLFNTHWHIDHTSGNGNLGKAGVVIIAHDNVYKRMSVENVIELLKQKLPPSPKEALPVITFNDSVTFHINGDAVMSYHVPPAHTDSDSIVWFKNANIVHTGDVFAAYLYPFIDVENGGSVPGIVSAIDRLLPTLNDSTRVIPGHGPLSGKKDVIAYRNMIAEVGARVEALVKSGKTLEQVIAAKPTREFDEVWGKFRKPDAFVEIMYYGYAPRKK
jgi:cyclase